MEERIKISFQYSQQTYFMALAISEPGFGMQTKHVQVQWLFLVPVKGGRYMLPSGGLYATYHLLREPNTTIDRSSLFGNLTHLTVPSVAADLRGLWW